MDVVSGKLLTGGQSMFECGGESSFFMISNLTSFEAGGSVGSDSVGSCISSLTSIGSVGVGSQSGDSYSMVPSMWRGGVEGSRVRECKWLQKEKGKVEILSNAK